MRSRHTRRVVFTAAELAEMGIDEEDVIMYQGRYGGPRVINPKHPPEEIANWCIAVAERLMHRLPNMAPFWVAGNSLRSRKEMEEFLGDRISIWSRRYECHFVEVDEKGKPVKEGDRYIEIGDPDIIDEWLRLHGDQDY